MTGYRSKHFRHRCPDRGCYVEQLPSWDDLIDCFPRRIRPTDIDGMVEINGQFLFLEEKGPGKAPDEGQRIALKKLSETPGITTVFFRPPARLEQPTDLECLTFGQGAPTGWQQLSRDQFKDWLRSWSSAADGMRESAA